MTGNGVLCSFLYHLPMCKCRWLVNQSFLRDVTCQLQRDRILTPFGSETLNIWACLLECVLSNTRSQPAIESQTLRDVVSTGERLVVGRVLMTSFELLDLAMLEECRPLNFPIRRPNKCFYIFWLKLICSLSLVFEGVPANQGINGS